MCGRFGFTKQMTAAERADYERELDKAIGPKAEPYYSYDCRPMTMRAVLTQEPSGIELSGFRWGWQRDFLKSRPVINARFETVAEKPMFADALRTRRCVVPATCYYEWRRDAKDHPLAKFAFRQAEGRPLLIAGLWEEAEGKDGLERRFLVLTRTMERYKDIHDRTPVLLTADAAEAWMDPKAPDREVLEAAGSCSDDDLIVRPVVNGPTKEKPEGPHLMVSAGEPWPW